MTTSARVTHHSVWPLATFSLRTIRRPGDVANWSLCSPSLGAANARVEVGSYRCSPCGLGRRLRRNRVIEETGRPGWFQLLLLFFLRSGVALPCRFRGRLVVLFPLLRASSCAAFAAASISSVARASVFLSSRWLATKDTMALGS